MGGGSTIFDSIADHKVKSREEIIENVRKESRTIRNKKMKSNIKCELCDEKFKPLLDMHHINYVSAGGGNDNKNLVFLCSNCHYIVHHIFSETNIGKYGISYIFNWIDRNFNSNKKHSFKCLIMRVPLCTTSYTNLVNNKNFELSNMGLEELLNYYQLHQYIDRKGINTLGAHNSLVELYSDYLAPLYGYVKTIDRELTTEECHSLQRVIRLVEEFVYKIKENYLS